jgi:hypothetical protein
MVAVKALYPALTACMEGRNAEARAALLMITVPRRMSCKRRRRSLKKATSNTNGVKKDTVNQKAMA